MDGWTYVGSFNDINELVNLSVLLGSLPYLHLDSKYHTVRRSITSRCCDIKEEEMES